MFICRIIGKYRFCIHNGLKSAAIMSNSNTEIAPFDCNHLRRICHTGAHSEIRSALTDILDLHPCLGSLCHILHAVLIHTIWYDCRSTIQVFHFNRLVGYILQFHLTYKCPQLLFGKRIIGHSGHNSLILRLFLNAKHILVNTHGLLSVRIGKSFIERTIHLQKSTIPHPAGMQICLMCRNEFHNRMILIL